MLKSQHKERILKIQQEVFRANLDLLLIVGRENLIYFTGSTQLECMALVIPKVGKTSAIALWQDVEYLRAVCPDLKVVGYHFPLKSLVTTTIDVIKSYGFKDPIIGFERYFVDFPVFEGLRNEFSCSNFVNSGDLLYLLRSVKSVEEIALIKAASEIVCIGMQAAVNALCIGVTELEILAEGQYAMMKAGSEEAPFRMQVVSGDRMLLTHPCASRKRIVENEAIVIHLGATYEGYCSKICRTVAIGGIPKGQEEVFKLLKLAQDMALAVIKPGVTSAEVDMAARTVIEKAGFSRSFLDITGYGVGLRQSEFYPIIGKGRDEVIKENMVLSILLPTIYENNIGGPRITDVVHVAQESPAILTDFPRDLIII